MEAILAGKLADFIRPGVTVRLVTNC